MVNSKKLCLTLGPGFLLRKHVTFRVLQISGDGTENLYKCICDYLVSIKYMCTRGGTQQKLELSSGGQASPARGVLGAPLPPGTSWHRCEGLRSVSVNFFGDFFKAFARFQIGDLH